MVNLKIAEEDVFLDFIQKHASIGTWEYNILENTLNWSDETRKIHEVPETFNPVVETAISFYKSGYSRTTIEKVFTNCIENFQSYDVELQIITARGNEKWVRAIGKPIIENNDCVKIIGIFQDIDEKTKNSKALVNSEKLLRKTFEHALIGMITVDLKGNFIDANKSFCNTLGYTKEELTKLSFLDITVDEDKSKGRKAIMDMLNGKIDNYQTEKRYIHKNGNVVWTDISAIIIKDNNGFPLHFVAQIKDITDIKNSANKVTDLLETTASQNERLINFAHIVSHNLRSHSSNLDMLLDIAKMDIPEATENEIFPLLREAVNHLSETVENLNEVASITSAKTFELEPINLLSTYKKIVKGITAQILESKTLLCINIEPNINIQGVQAYLDSILLNFLTNAIKYKKPNEPAKIEIDAVEENGNVILTVKDYGLGIDLEKHGDKLFGMYKTFHKHHDSRGIGLFITKNQIEAIGGKVEVESKINEGTTFKTTFNSYEKN